MDIVTRLKQLAHAVADEDWSEFSLRVPADSERDADLVLLRASKEIESLRTELAECRRGAERYRTALEQIVAPFEDLNFVSGNKPLTYIYYVATDALAAKGSE